MNKYNEYMSHIEVTDEMKARVLANVSKAIAEQKTDGAVKADVTPMPVARKKRPLPIAAIISIAASVLIVGGIAVLFLSGYMSSGPAYSSSKSKNADTAEETVAAAAGEYYAKDSVDGALDYEETAGDIYDAGDDGVEWDTEETTVSTTTETASVTRPAKGPEVVDIPDENIQMLMPDSSVETSTSVENGTSIITFNAATNSGTLYIADEGVDLASTYLAGVTWNTSNSTSGVTEGGIPYALVNTNTPDVSNFNAATFEHDGKTYLIVFDTPVPEESLRTVIEDY